MENGLIFILIATLVIILAAIGIVVFVLIKGRKGQLTETPNEMQYANRQYITGEGHVDTNIVKVGKVKTLKSYSSQGFISWNEFYYPTSEESQQKRKPAIFAIVAMFFFFFILFVVFALTDMIFAMLFMLFLMIYLVFLITFKFLKIKVLKRPDKH